MESVKISLSKLDQKLGLRIRNLLGNTLEVERLTTPAALSAIERPIGVLNKRLSGSGQTMPSNLRYQEKSWPKFKPDTLA